MAVVHSAAEEVVVSAAGAERREASAGHCALTSLRRRPTSVPKYAQPRLIIGNTLLTLKHIPREASREEHHHLASAHSSSMKDPLLSNWQPNGAHTHIGLNQQMPSSQAYTVAPIPCRTFVLTASYAKYYQRRVDTMFGEQFGD